MPLVLPSELQQPQQEGGSASSRGKGEVPPSECGEDLIAVKGLAPPLTKAYGHDATALEKVGYTSHACRCRPATCMPAAGP